MNDKRLKPLGMIVVVVLLMSIAAAGCTTSQTPASNTTATTTVTDTLGRTVAVPYNINRIVTFNAVPPLNSLIMLFGRGNDIINNIPSSMATMPASFVPICPGPAASK